MGRRKRIEQIITRCKQTKIAFADTETTDDVFDAAIGPYHGTTYEYLGPKVLPRRHAGARVFGVALADDAGSTCFVRRTDAEYTLACAVLADRRITKVWHNYPYDKIACDVSGIVLDGPFEDTLPMARLWDDDKPHGLKPLYDLLTGNTPQEEKDMKDDLRRKRAASTRAGNPKGYVNFSFVERSLMDRYARGDVFKTSVLWGFLRTQLDADAFKLYELDKRCMSIAVEMTHRGVPFSVDAARAALRQSSRVERSLANNLCKTAVSAGIADFAPSKNKKILELLTTKGVPSFLLNKKGKPCVDKACLSGLQANGVKSATARRVLDYRSVYKLNHTYLQPLMGYAKFHSGSIHAMWNVGGARTGRFSSNKPNLQNISKKGNKTLRRIFTVRDGYVNLYIDYSQVELRYLAALTQDPDMLAAYAAGSDIHDLTAKALGISRDQAKAVNFGIVYGEGAAALATSLGIAFALASQFIKGWYGRFPAVRRTNDKLRRMLKSQGYVTDMFGRRYHYPAKAPYKAINAVIQGGCAVLFKRGMDNVHKVTQSLTDTHIIKCIHDELGIETTETMYSKKIVKKLTLAMEDVPEFKAHGVDLIAEPCVAYDNWANKQPVEGWRNA